MFHTLNRTAAALLVLALLLGATGAGGGATTQGAAVATPAAPAATGSIAGVVLGADDAPAANVQVRLMRAFERGERKAAKAKRAEEKPAAEGEPATAETRAAPTNPDQVEAPAAPTRPEQVETPAAPGKPEKPDRPVPVATGRTDGAGKFELRDVPAGKYTVIANGRDAGRARQPVEVKGGESASVSLKLAKREGAAGAGGGVGPAGAAGGAGAAGAAGFVGGSTGETIGAEK